MDATGILERLKAKFGDGAGALVTENPDPYIVVKKESLHDVCAFLAGGAELDFEFLESQSGVDLGDKLQMVYHLFSYKQRHGIVLKVDVPYDQVELPTVTDIWAAANWHEREQYDLFGFKFTGHPDLRRILLPEDWVGHPLLKSYVYPEQYHGIDHHRPDPKEQFKALDELTLKAREKQRQIEQAQKKPETAAVAAEASAPVPVTETAAPAAAPAPASAEQAAKPKPSAE